ncbi:hypothetical protein M8J76_001454, partial [Diaphorina citri]
NQDLSKSQIRYLLQQSIKKIQPERFYVDKDEQAKNPSFIGYLSTGDSYLKPEDKNGKDQFTLPVNFHIPTTKRSNDLMTSSQQYPDQLYHQQQLGQVPNNNNGYPQQYPQQELILNYPNYQPSLPNVQQQFPQNYVQPAQNYIQSPQASQGSNQQNPQPILTLQQYQNMLNQNQPNTGLSQGQQYQQPISGLPQNQQYNQQQNQQYNQQQNQQYSQPQNQQFNQLITGLPQTQQFNQPIAGLPIKPTTVPLAIPILQRFLERPLQPLPEQLNIQQPQQPVPLPPQLYLIPQQQGFQQQPLQGNQLGALNLQPQPQQQFQPLQQNQANGISLRADLQDNLFPQNEDRKYQQPVFSINEPPPPEEQQIENPPDQQRYNGAAQKYPLSPNQLQNQPPVNVQNLPLVNTQPVYSGQQISQQVNQGQPYYNAQGYPAQGMQNQYGPQGPLPNYQDEQQQYDRPQSDQLNAQNQGNGAVQGEDQTTETPIKYNINDEPPPISNFQDLLKPPTVDDGGTYVTPQQEQRYRNMNQATPTPTPAYNEPPSPNRLIYTTPDPQKFDDRVAGLRPPLQEQDPFMRGDPGYRPTGKPSPVVMGLRDINIIPIDLINRNTSEKLKYDLPNDLFTLPVHFATPNKTLDYIKQKQEERLKLNSQNIQNLYDLQQANKQQYDPLNSQNRDGDKNTDTISRNELQKRDQSSGKITPKVGEENSKQRTKRHYIYEHPKIPFNLPGEIGPYSTPTTYDNSLAPSNTYLPYTPNTFSPSYGPPLYQGDTGYQYNPYPHYVAKQTPFIIILRFCPIIIQEPRRDNTTGVPRTPAGPMTTTTTTTETPEEPVTPPSTPAPEANNTDNPQSPPRCVWATVSCCTPGRMDMGLKRLKVSRFYDFLLLQGIREITRDPGAELMGTREMEDLEFLFPRFRKEYEMSSRGGRGFVNSVILVLNRTLETRVNFQRS